MSRRLCWTVTFTGPITDIPKKKLNKYGGFVEWHLPGENRRAQEKT